MLALLIITGHAIPSAAPAERPECARLDEKQVASLTRRAVNEIDTNPYDAPSLGELAKYWNRTCSGQRYEASQHIVRNLSSLLSHHEIAFTIARMLIDIGPNLKASRRDLDAAIAAADLREDAMFKASGPLVPTSGRVLSYSLRCVRIKMLTGRLDRKYCSYIINSGF